MRERERERDERERYKTREIERERCGVLFFSVKLNALEVKKICL